MKKKLWIIIAAVILVAAAVVAAILFWPGSGVIDNRTVLLSDTEIELLQGSTYNLTAKLSLGRADFTWSSSDEAVATVTDDGMVSGVGVGTATVTASYGEKSASCTVTVILPEYCPVFTSTDQVLQVAVGQSYPIDTAVTFNGEPVTATLSFDSADTSIVTVMPDGYVMGASEGETYIDVTADYQGRLASMRVKVIVSADIIIQAESSQIRLDSLPVPSLGLTDAKKLELQVLHKGNDVTEDLSFTWSVEQDGIVSYSSSANAMDIAVKKVGSTAITATFELDGKSYDYRYYVEVVTTHLTVTPEEGYLSADLSGVEGSVSGITVGGKSFTSALSGTELRIYKTKLDAGEYAATVKTGSRSYEFILEVDRETVELRSETKTAEEGAYVVDMSYAGIDWDEVLEFTVNGRDANDRRSGNVLTLKRSSTPYGNYTVKIITKGRTDYQYNLFCYTSKLSSSTVRSTADLLMFLQGAPQADFTLESDIDFGGAAFDDYIADFGGTLDGKGHVLKNFKIVANTLYSVEGTDQTAVYLFQNVSGTIKNTGFIYELAEIRDCNLSSLIGKNNGTIENCFASMNFTATHKSWDIAPLVNSNQGVGVVRNCIALVTKNTAAVTTTRFGAVVAAAIGNSTVKNCYGVYNDVLGTQDQSTPHISGGVVSGATVQGCKNFATGTQLCSGVKSFPTSDGWSSYWKHEGDVIFFGGTPVTEITLAAQTAELTEGYYTVNLSKVSRTIASINIDGKEYKEYLSQKTLKIPQANITMGEHEAVITSTSGVVYRLTLTCLIPGQSLEDYLTLTFREGGTNRLIYISQTTPTMNVDFSIDPNLEGVEPGTVLVKNATVYVNGRAHLATITYQQEVVGNGKGYLQVAVVAPTGWTPTKGSDNYASDPAVTMDVLIPEGIVLGDTGKMTTATRYLLYKSKGLDTSTDHPRKTLTAEKANPADYEYAPEDEATVEIVGCRYGRAIYLNKSMPRLDVEFFLNTVLENTSGSESVPYPVASGVTVYVNGLPHTVNVGFNENTNVIAFSVTNPTGWTPVEGGNDYATDPEVSFDILIPKGTQFDDGSVLSKDARYIVTKSEGLVQTDTHPRKECTSTNADPAAYVYSTVEQELQGITGLRWARAIYVNKTTPQLDLNLFTDLEFTEESGTVVARDVSVYVNGKEYTTVMTYYVESGTGMGYIQFSVQNPGDWAPTEGGNDYASDPAYTFDVLLPEGLTFNGGQTLPKAARYVITKTVGLSQNDTHPRKECTGEAADPDSYVFESEVVELQGITGLRWARAIYVNKTTPQLDLNLFTDLEFTEESGTVVASDVTVYVNGKEYTVVMTYYVESGTGLGYIQFSVQNPGDWTPTEGGNDYASDPAYTFDVLLPEGLTFNGGQTLPKAARYVITKTMGLSQNDTHPRKECTGEAADPDSYVFESETVEVQGITGLRWARAIYINKTTPQLDLNLFTDLEFTEASGTVVASDVTVYVGGKAYTTEMTYYVESGTGLGYIQFSVQNPGDWTPTEGGDDYASDPAYTFDVLLPEGLTFNGGQTLPKAARYVITKTVGLSQNDTHPRKECTGEAAEAADYVFEAQTQYVSITGWRYTRAIYINKTTPTLDNLDFFVDAVLANADAEVVAEGVTVYINGVAYTVNIEYKTDGFIKLSGISNPAGWTPVEGSDDYASDPAVTFDMLIPAGIEFTDGHVLQEPVRYIITKAEGLINTNVHPRRDCTAEAADPDEYAFEAEPEYLNITGWRYTRAIYINKTTPTLDNLDFFVDTVLTETNEEVVAENATIYVNGVAYSVEVKYYTDGYIKFGAISNPAGWTPVKGSNNYASDPAVTFDVLIPAGIEFTGGYVLETPARYILTKPVGLDASTAHPRANCTAEAADPAGYALPATVEAEVLSVSTEAEIAETQATETQTTETETQTTAAAKRSVLRRLSSILSRLMGL